MTSLLKTTKSEIKDLFEVGAHYGFSKSRRHPSVSPYIFGIKNNIEIFDLEKVLKLFDNAKAVVEALAKEGKTILFVTGKKEIMGALEDIVMKIDQPYVAGRWIGGTLTNFEEIQKRTSRLEDLTKQKDKGELAKYTKKERLLIDREIKKLEERFGGIVSMKKKPDALFVIDAKQEFIAVDEAVALKIPVISLCSSDCNISNIKYPIVANDSSIDSIKYFLNEIADTYKKHKKSE